MTTKLLVSENLITEGKVVKRPLHLVPQKLSAFGAKVICGQPEETVICLKRRATLLSRRGASTDRQAVS